MIEVLAPPDIEIAHKRPAMPPGQSSAAQLQERVHERIMAMSPQKRQDLVGRNNAEAEANRLTLRPFVAGKEATVPVPLTTVPAFLDRETMLGHAQDVQIVYDTLLKIEALALSGTDLGKEVFATITKGMSEEQVGLIKKAKTRPRSSARNRNARADAFIDGTDMNIIEMNNVNPEGLKIHREVQRTGFAFLKNLDLDLPTGRYYDLAEQTWGTAADQVLNMLEHEMTLREKERLGRIGIIYEQGVPLPGETDHALLNRSELPELGEYFRSHTGDRVDVVHGGPTDVWAQNGEMAVAGQPVDLLWRNAVDIPKAVNNPASAGLIEVISNPHIYPVQNDETSQIIGSKATLSLLYDERVRKAIGMTEEERKAVERAVPFSFTPGTNVQISNGSETMSAEKYLKKFRKCFILKPSTGTHGDEVVFGPNGGKAWDEAVARAVESGEYTAQLYIPYDRIRVPVMQMDDEGYAQMGEMVRDTNIHKIGERVAGTVVLRVAPVKEDGPLTILNVAAGGGVQAGFMVSNRR